MTWIHVAMVDEIQEDEIKPIWLDDLELALYRTSDRYYATSGVCTHANRSLTRGWVSKGVVTCPRHGGKFDVKTGQAVAPPCVVSLQTYNVEVRANEIWVHVDNA
jgi:3-phenylpropionate/trans-cinnamate dioxygenase ferredoxin component